MTKALEAWRIAKGEKSAPYKVFDLIRATRDQYLRRVYRHRAWDRWEWLGGPLDCAASYGYVAPGEIIAEYAPGEQTPSAWGLAVMRWGKIVIVPLDAVQVGDKWRLRLRGAPGEVEVPDPLR